MSKKRVEKMNKSKHVRPSADRRNPDLPGYLYRPLDQRKSGNEPVLFRLHRGKRGPSDGDESLKTFKQNKNERLYDFNDYPASEFERMHMT